MASLAQQFGGLKCPPLSTTRLSKKSTDFNGCFHNFNCTKPKNQHPSGVVVAAATVGSVAITNTQLRERLKLKEMFEDAYERCRTTPLEGVAFNLEDFQSAIGKYDFSSEIGSKASSGLCIRLKNKIFFECFFVYLAVFHFPN